MTPSPAPRDDPRSTRLVHVDPAQDRITDHVMEQLAHVLSPLDLLVVNDAATMPASLHGHANGEPIEVRLLAQEPDGAFRCVLFGSGDFRTRTENRAPPPWLERGALLDFATVQARVELVDARSARLLRIRFDCDGTGLWGALYASGRPVQYAHVTEPLELWHVQTAYASRPWASEAPSAGLGLTWELLLALRSRGIGLATLTHAAGLSATGDPTLDALLPLGERYDIPERTVEAIERTRAQLGRVVAVGTTVVRALESAARRGDAGGGVPATTRLTAGAAFTELRLGEETPRRVVDGLLTGIHDPGTSHFELLRAFAGRELLARALAHAEANGYLGHEFGDAMVVLAS